MWFYPSQQYAISSANLKSIHFVAVYHEQTFYWDVLNINNLKSQENTQCNAIQTKSIELN